MNARYRPWMHTLVCFSIGATFFLWGLSQLASYGASWDEPLHLSWGKLFLLSLDLDRSYLYMMPGNGVYYSPLFYVCTFLIAEPLHALGMPLYQAAHLLTLVTSSVGLAVTAGIAIIVTGRKTAGILATLCMVGFPQFLAHAHYNPKDLPLLTAVACAAAVYVYALRSQRSSILILASLLFGIAVALKVSAVLVLPSVIVSFVMHRWKHPMPWSRVILQILLLVLAFVLGIILAWPSAWGDLHLIVASMRFFFTENFWPGHELYFGQTYTGAALPWHYIPLTFFLSTPFLLALAMIAGIVIALRRYRQPVFAFLALWVIVPLLVSVLPGIVRYDGIRQFFFILPALAVLGGSALDRLFSSVRSPLLRAGMILLLLGSLTYESWLLHPYQGSYRNEIARVLYPQDMDRVFALEYWGATYAEGFQWLDTHAQDGDEVCIPIAGALVRWYSFSKHLTISCSSETDYVIFFTRYDLQKQAAYEHLAPVFTLERMGATLLKIYRVRGTDLA